MNARSIISLLLLAPLLLFGCSRRREELRFASAQQGTLPFAVARSLTTVWNKQQGPKVTLLAGAEYDMTHNVDLLASGKAELALAQNDLGMAEGVADSSKSSALRTVLPVYPEILFIVYKDSLKPTSLRDLVKGRRVALGLRSSGTDDFTRILFKRFAIDSADYTPIYTSLADRRLSDTVDICCFLTGLDNPAIASILAQPNAHLFSLDDIDLANRGSLADGFCLNYEGARPVIVPRGAFGAKPTEPVLTVGVDAVLLARADVDRLAINSLVQTMLDNHHALADMERSLENVSAEFDRGSLHFPLHEGTLMYLNREEPSFVEKYADLVGVVFSLAAGAIGAISAVVQWNKRRRKDQINNYYMEVATIDGAVPGFTRPSQCDEALARLQSMKSRAFLHVAQEKLDADESFHVLISFIDNTLHAVHGKRESLTSEAVPE